ncbi:fatty acid desaturase family protein [Roseovarius sp. SK2]|uniref:fatty acid desaturase family protein n=1 Tax=Roseovarius TaxID=74030 RepID=UPI00237C103C|nr:MULTISPECIES: fatty acid desaturase family protein [unclassified Roseovarius]MDD9726618.1 fatty acid desaturase family protein [Roseovarius sp. SK2]
MDHREFIAALPRDKLAGLAEAENAPGLFRLALHFGLIVLFGVWIGLGGPLWWALLIPQGIAICFLFTLEHEATHKTPFRTLWLNEWVGRVCGLLIVQPFEWFRYFHLAHHRHTNIPGKDPELLAGAKPESWRAYVWHVTGLPFWWAMIGQTLRNAVGGDPGDYVPERARPRVVREARVMLTIYALAFSSLPVTPVLFWAWIFPALLGQPFLRLYLLAEHGRCAFVADMFRNTRTTYTNRLVRFLAWNMPYHTEHHALPQVPFHRLPELHGMMQGHHGVTSEGYAAFNRDYTSGFRKS